jgi:hypothetical protein
MHQLAKIGEKALDIGVELSTPSKSTDPTRSQSASCRLLLGKTFAAAEVSARRALGVKNKFFKSAPGRRKGWRKMSDADLHAALARVAAPSGDVSLTLRRPILALDRSKSASLRKNYHVIPYKKSQFCKRLQSCRLGIRGPVMWKGRCDLCQSWTRSRGKQFENFLREGMELLEHYDKNYFKDFSLTVAEEKLDTETLRRHENPEYWAKLIELIAARSEDGTAEDERHTAEHLFLEDLKVRKESEVDLVGFHLSLKATVEATYETCATDPEPRTTHLLWDHMVSIFII